MAGQSATLRSTTMHKLLILVSSAFACALFLSCSPDSRAEPWHHATPNGAVFEDKLGRDTMLRGMNIRAAGYFDAHHEIEPLPAFEASDCEVLGRDFGMNVLRLSLNWSLIEPARGEYDMEYLERAATLINACAEHEVAVLVDLHQDGYSKYLGYDGAPYWAHLEPRPAEDESDGGSAGEPIGRATLAAYRALFTNEGGLRDAYAAMLAVVTRKLGRLPGVIGIELMNEPLSLFNQRPLFAFYEVLAAAIRRENAALPIYFEPSAERNIVGRSQSLPAVGFERHVYAPHLYTGVILEDWSVGDRARIETSLLAAKDEAASLGAPLFIGEFGHNMTSDVGFAWVKTVVELLEEQRVSSAFWVYEEWPSTCQALVEFTGACWGMFDSALRPDGQYERSGLRDEAVYLLARPHALAIAGTVTRTSFVETTREYRIEGGLAGTHVIGLPSHTYPTGAVATCDGATAPVQLRPGRAEVACHGALLELRPAASDEPSRFELALERLTP